MTAGDRWYDQSIVASCDRSYEQSWHPVTERTIDRGTRRPMVRSIAGTTIDRTINRSIVRPNVRSIVATYDRSYGESWHSCLSHSVFGLVILLCLAVFILFTDIITNLNCLQTKTMNSRLRRTYTSILSDEAR